MSLIVKICGLSTRETLDAALDAGADMVGFVFFPPSPRHLSLEIARDLGREIEIASGLGPEDRVITAPPDGLADGDLVRVVGPSAKGKPATASETQDVKG